jgi:thioredoxin domain-containing protein 5
MLCCRLKFIHGTEEKRYQGKRELNDLSSFVDEMLQFKEEQNEMASKPEVIEGLAQLTTTTFDSAIAQGYYFIKFYAPWCGHCQKLAPTWGKLAAHFKDDEVVNIAKIDCTQEKDVCTKNRVGGYPTLFLFQDGQNIQRYTAGRSLEELIAFVEKHRPAEGAPAEEAPDTEEVPAEEEPPVIELTSETFIDGIKEGATLVKFFAPWCGHCKRLAPVWDQLGQIVKDEKLPISIAKLDCTANSKICEENHVHGYPTLILFRDGVKEKEYKGSRVLEDLVQFVSDNVQ